MARLHFWEEETEVIVDNPNSPGDCLEIKKMQWFCSDGISVFFGDTKAEAASRFGVPVGDFEDEGGREMKKLLSDIRKIKANLVKKAQKDGLYENFGQVEVRKLQDKYQYYSLVYGTPEERSMASAITAFEDWCCSYDGR